VFELVEFETAGGLLVADCEDDCAFTFAANIAAKKTQTQMMLLNRFTLKIVSDDTNSPVSQTDSVTGDGEACLIVKNFTSTFLKISKCG
jgi:hypothetical protein